MKFSATSLFFLAVLPKCRLHSKCATKFNTLFKIIDLSVVDVIYPDEMVMTIGLNPAPLVVFSGTVPFFPKFALFLYLS